MTFETQIEEGLYDHNYQPVALDSVGVQANHHNSTSSAIASGMVEAGLQGQNDLVQNAVDALKDMEAGDSAST